MKREIEMLKIPNSIPVKTRLPLSAWAVAALLSIVSVASSLLQLSPVDHTVNARAEQMNLPSDHTKDAFKNMMAATGLIATFW
jgi:hypothetical protein